jgi:hypothetical protein
MIAPVHDDGESGASADDLDRDAWQLGTLPARLRSLSLVGGAGLTPMGKAGTPLDDARSSAARHWSGAVGQSALSDTA